LEPRALVRALPVFARRLSGRLPWRFRQWFAVYDSGSDASAHFLPEDEVMLVGMFRNEFSQKVGKMRHSAECNRQPGQAFMSTLTKLSREFNR
jgi:hypothetical protein